MNSKYVDWLKRQGVKLFEGGGMCWMLYQRALIPVPNTPCFIEPSHDDAKALLKESGAWFMRYASEPCEEKTEWWYVICDAYDSKKFSSKTRYNINRSQRVCSVRQIDAEWLAKHGFECHFAAYSRYKNATPDSEEIFRSRILETINGPFEYWGVFVEGKLVGYCQCIVDRNCVSTSVSKYHPAYLKYRSAYALIYNLVQHYVVEFKMTILSGSRNIAHDTNYQNFLIKLGYRRQFCRLNVVYQPWLKFTIKTIFPLHRLIAKMPNRGSVHKMQSLLFQEELRKTFDV